MKRMQLVAAALCLIMLTTIGAGAVAAKQTENPRQAGTSHIYLYDVTATDTHGKGKLQINLDKHTFEFNGQGFPPSAQIALKARAADSTEYKVFATGKATPSGNLHIAGTWSKTAAAQPGSAGFGVVAFAYYPQIHSFSLYNTGWFVAKIACYYSADNGVTWHESSKSPDILKGNYANVEPGELGVPHTINMLVKIHVVVVAGKDRTGSEVFEYRPFFSECWSSPDCGAYAGYEITGKTLSSSLHYCGRVAEPWQYPWGPPPCYP